jgi:hypothetical protein
VPRTPLASTTIMLGPPRVTDLTALAATLSCVVVTAGHPSRRKAVGPRAPTRPLACASHPPHDVDPRTEPHPTPLLRPWLTWPVYAALICTRLTAPRSRTTPTSCHGRRLASLHGHRSPHRHRMKPPGHVAAGMPNRGPAAAILASSTTLCPLLASAVLRERGGEGVEVKWWRR